MDEKTIRRVKEHLETIATEEEIELDEVIIFGSRAREDYRSGSDIDILIVSQDFESVPKARRSREFYLKWSYEKLPEPEFICLTPREFAEKKAKKPHIVRTAMEEGVSLT